MKIFDLSILNSKSVAMTSPRCFLNVDDTNAHSEPSLDKYLTSISAVDRVGVGEEDLVRGSCEEKSTGNLQTSKLITPVAISTVYDVILPEL